VVVVARLRLIMTLPGGARLGATVMPGKRTHETTRDAEGESVPIYLSVQIHSKGRGRAPGKRIPWISKRISDGGSRRWASQQGRTSGHVSVEPNGSSGVAAVPTGVGGLRGSWVRRARWCRGRTCEGTRGREEVNGARAAARDGVGGGAEGGRLMLPGHRNIRQYSWEHEAARRSEEPGGIGWEGKIGEIQAGDGERWWATSGKGIRMSSRRARSSTNGSGDQVRSQDPGRATAGSGDVGDGGGGIRSWLRHVVGGGGPDDWLVTREMYLGRHGI
jgi:hypothetical protein